MCVYMYACPTVLGREKVYLFQLRHFMEVGPQHFGSLDIVGPRNEHRGRRQEIGRAHV